MYVAATTKNNGVIVSAHQGFFTVVVIYAALIGLWGLFLYVRGSNPSSGYIGAIVIMEGIAIVQGLIGLAVVISGHRPHDPLHYVYGVVAVVVLPAAYFFSDNASERKDSLIFGLAGLLLVGIAIRAAATGGT